MKTYTKEVAAMSASPADNAISPAEAADKLIAAHDGDVALLYIYMTRRSCDDMEQAAHDLCRTLREIEAAAEKLRRMGLLLKCAPTPTPTTTPAEQTLPPAEELPQYSSDEIVRRTTGDAAFSCLVEEAARVLGHVLSGDDLKKLFGIYDQLAMPAEVIMELLNYCADVARSGGKSGSMVRTSMFRVVKEAYFWANREILTLEQAEDYIRFKKERMGNIGSLRTALGIAEHKMVKAEEEYLGAWLDMGFDEETISLAYERTVEHTGKLSWKYMDSIMRNWQSKGIRCAVDVAEKDPPRKGTKGAFRQTDNRKPFANSSMDISDLDKALDKI